MVDWREGDINFSIIKHVTDPSHEPVSSKFSPDQNNDYGPLLSTTKRYNSTNNYFDGYTRNHWNYNPNRKKNVANPHGNNFIRVE